MRLEPSRLTSAEAEELLLYLVDCGVDSFHSSHEYETHAFFCETLRRVKAARPGTEFVHVAKIGVPHFDETRFEPARLRAIVETQLADLGAERIDIVQWLLRQTPNDDARRVPLLKEQGAEAAAAFETLRREGKIGEVASFPYTPRFADEMLRYEFCRGLVTYLNPSELEFVPYLDDLRRAGRGFIAIRPLYAGAFGTSEAQARMALTFPLLHPAVTSIMVSVSTLRHAQIAIETAASTRTDPERFFALAEELRQRQAAQA